MRYSSKGNSLIEYTVIGTLVAIVSIAGMVICGGQLTSLLQGLKADLRHNSSAAMTASQSAPATTP